MESSEAQVESRPGTLSRIPPGLALLLLAPALGELISGHMPPAEFFNPLSFAILALPYGCGALICRELVVRWGRGWPSLLLLGVAYALFEEGIVVRSIFDPHWSELGELARYDHFAGVNWTYAELLIHFHVCISIGASVMLAEIMHPQRRRQSWIGNKALAACAIVMLLWIACGWLIMTSYRPPLIWLVAPWLAVLGLTLAARYVPVPAPPPTPRPAPRPLYFFLLGLVNMPVLMLTPDIVAERDVMPLSAAVLLLLAVDAATLWLIARWSANGHAWDDRHRLALIAGLLGFFLFFGGARDLDGWQGRSVVAILAAILLWRLARRVNRRVQADAARSG
jgi:hypothetical protein